MTTYVLKSEGQGSTLSVDLTHELLHYTRDASGVFIYPPTDPNSESRIQAVQDGVYNQIYHSKTVNLDGSATNSATITAPSDNALVYGTNGNNVITAQGGNNTIVAYSSNDILIGGSGNDFFKVLGNGAKVIDDIGGTNQLYVPWAHSFYDFKTVLSADGTLFLAPVSSSTSADQSPDRIVIPDWSDTHFHTVQFTNSSGQIGYAIVTNLIAGDHGGGGGHLTAQGDSASIDSADSAVVMPSTNYSAVVGTPQPGYYDPYVSQGSSQDQTVGSDVIAKSVASEPAVLHAEQAYGLHSSYDWIMAA